MHIMLYRYMKPPAFLGKDLQEPSPLAVMQLRSFSSSSAAHLPFLSPTFSQHGALPISKSLNSQQANSERESPARGEESTRAKSKKLKSTNSRSTSQLATCNVAVCVAVSCWDSCNLYLSLDLYIYYCELSPFTRYLNTNKIKINF